ncbi:MAG: LysR family transcriptional regulator [Lachnospiraceae bacterium]|nr:LysR family transcriptional regulator [Lachnospiraceae bacterium]MCM1234363.1 LysR family transcriptional regulator [Ruminococcus flavefaciens]
MELTQLIQFKAIAECESMTQAAEKIHISQPTLSAMLKRLEHELEMPLFDRNKNRLKLNEAGSILLRHTDLILTQLDQAKSELRDYAKKDSTIRIGFCDPGPMWYFTPRYSYTRHEKALEPGLYDDIENETAYLLNDKYDALISFGHIDHPDIISRPLIHEHFMLSVTNGSPLAKQREVSIRSLKLPSILLLDVGGSFFRSQEAFWRELEPDTKLELCDDFFIYNQLVQNSDVVTTSTRISRHYGFHGIDRILIPVTDPELSVDYHISFLKKNKKRVSFLIEWLEQCCEEIENSGCIS